MFAEFEWLEQMDGRIMLTDPANQDRTQIAHCDAKLIRRGQIRNIFYHEMEEPSSETSQLAFDLFDRFGRLRKEFKEHEIKRGSGIWQDELDWGDLLLFESLTVEKPYRRRGLGRKLVHAMLERARPKSTRFFAIAFDAYLTSEVEKEADGLKDEEVKAIQTREARATRDFWRSLGFRRVGSSSWFALASDEHHLCHSMPKEADYDPPVRPEHILQSDIESLFPDFPAIEDQECQKRIQEKFQGLTINAPLWQTADESGNTVLHLAAINAKPRSVEWILSQNAQLLSCRNDEGETPLEALEFRLERERKNYAWRRHLFQDSTSLGQV